MDYLHTDKGYNRSAIMIAAWIEVRNQIAYHASLADILPTPSTGSLLSKALKTVWRIARAQRAKAIEAARIASPEFQAEVATAREAKRAAYDASQARSKAAQAARDAAETAEQRTARLASLAAQVNHETRANLYA